MSLVLDIQGSMCLHSAGISQVVPGIPEDLVFRDLWASTVLGFPRILSIQGSLGLHNAETSRDVPGIPGYLVSRDLWASTVLRIPRMSWESWDT